MLTEPGSQFSSNKLTWKHHFPHSVYVFVCLGRRVCVCLQANYNSVNLLLTSPEAATQGRWGVKRGPQWKAEDGPHWVPGQTSTLGVRGYADT